MASIETKVVVVVGAGPGIGGSVGKKFYSEGFSVALLSRSLSTTEPVQKQILSEYPNIKNSKIQNYSCDVSKEDQVIETFKKIRNDLGFIEVLIYNAAARRFKKQEINEIDSKEFIKFWEINVLGAFNTVRQVIPEMKEKKKGTIIFTGATASWRGSEGLAPFTVSKFGLRALAGNLARECGKYHVHVVHVVIEGAVDIPKIREMFEKANNGPLPEGKLLKPNSIANSYFELYKQDFSCWTLELDLRPALGNIYAHF